MSNIYKNFETFFAENNRGKSPTVYALAAAEDPHTLQAAMQAYEDGYAKPILIGVESEIRSIMNELGKSCDDIEIINVTEGAVACAPKAIDLINEGRASFIAKGLMDTSVILKAMLKKENQLNPGGFVSIVTFMELTGYHKMLCVTDVGLNMFPDLSQKQQMLLNAVRCCKSVGIENPKGAVLCSVESVNPKMKDTMDAQALKQMYAEGEITGCIVEGPISYDLAICKESAEIKGYDSPVAGDADILLMPDISAGNISLKALIRAGAAKVASVTVGLNVPLAFASRSAPIDEKYRTIILAATACQETQAIKKPVERVAPGTIIRYNTCAGPINIQVPYPDQPAIEKNDCKNGASN